MAIHPYVSFGKADMPGPDRFDRALQYQARLKVFQQEIFVTDFPVRGETMLISI
jgi:hypothetical protein